MFQWWGWLGAVVLMPPENVIISQQAQSVTFKIRREGAWVMSKAPNWSPKGQVRGCFNNEEPYSKCLYMKSLSLEYWGISRLCIWDTCSVSRNWKDFWCLFLWGSGRTVASDRLHLAGVAETHGSKSLTLPPIPPRWNFQLFVFLTDELTWVIPRIGRHSFINAKAQNKHTPKNEKKTKGKEIHNMGSYSRIF